MLIVSFASQVNFLDPLLTNEGDPYGPYRYKELVKECFMISKNCNTSYNDVLNLTPREKNYLLEFIIDEAKRTQEIVEKNKEALQNR